MKNHQKNERSIFQRHPAITIFAFCFAAILALDVISANIYELVRGHPWNKRQAKEWEKVYKQIFVRSDIYHHGLAENASIPRINWGTLVYSFYTNSLGFRDKTPREIPLVSKHYRIILIGDSFTEGKGYDYQDTYAGIITDRLAGEGIDVLNAAASSYCPVIYWRKIKYLIEEVGLKFNELVVFLDISDIQDEAVFYSLDEAGNVVKSDRQENKIEDKLVVPDEADLYSGMGSKIGANLMMAFKNNSILFYSAFDRIRAIGKPKPKRQETPRALWTVDKDIYNEFAQVGLKEAEYYMNKLYELLKKNGIKLTVVVYPWPEQVIHNDSQSIQASFWRDWSERHNVDFLDCFLYFFKDKGGSEAVLEKYYIQGDQHFNRNGHHLIADSFLLNRP